MKNIKAKGRGDKLIITMRGHLCRENTSNDLHRLLRVLPEVLEGKQSIHFNLNAFGSVGLNDLLTPLQDAGLPMFAKINGISAGLSNHITNLCEEVSIVKGSKLFTAGEWLTAEEAIEDGWCSSLDTKTTLNEPAFLYQYYLKTDENREWFAKDIEELETIRDIEKYLCKAAGFSISESLHLISVVKRIPIENTKAA